MKTTTNKHLKDDNVIEQFYLALANDDIKAISRIHIPRSDVFYVREKYYNDTGVWVSLDRMERSMYLEGMLTADDVKEPNRVRTCE